MFLPYNLKEADVYFSYNKDVYLCKIKNNKR